METTQPAMKELKHMFVEQTEKTPLVDFNNLTGELILSGRSIPINAPRIFEPILEWVNNYIKDPRPTTNLIVKALTNIEKQDCVLFLHVYFSLEDFDDIDDIKDDLSPVIDVVSNSKVSVGLKIYGTDEAGKIMKESMIFI